MAWQSARTDTGKHLVQEFFRQEINDEPFIEVVGRNGALNLEQADFQHFQNKVNDEYANAETNFSITFHPWEKWLGMQIDGSTLEKFTASHIAAHCIWDMTFHGFEQWQIQETLYELKRRIEEIESMTEEERDKFLIPWNDVKKKPGLNGDDKWFLIL